MWTLLLTLSCHALLAAAIDPAKNADVPACRALAESIGPEALPQCHIMLSPTHFGYSTSVHAAIKIRTIYGLDESELVEWSGWLHLTWLDPRLAWNASNSELKLRVDRNSLWVPDVGFWNAKDSELFHIRNVKFFEADVSPNGNVELYVYVVVRSACALKIGMFPFDRQVCSFQLGATSSNSYESFNFTASCQAVFNITDGVPFYQVGEWDLRKVSHKRQFVQHGKDEYAEIEFRLQRRWTYYVVLVIVPFELLSLLASIMFLTGDKGDPVGMSIAIIMSLTVYVLIASQSAPKSMDVVPLVGLFLMIQMLILVVFTFLAALHVKDQTPGDGEDVTVTVRCKAVFIRYKNTFCFVSYILISLINAVVFLYIWPVAIGDNH